MEISGKDLVDITLLNKQFKSSLSTTHTYLIDKFLKQFPDAKITKMQYRFHDGGVETEDQIEIMDSFYSSSTWCPHRQKSINYTGYPVRVVYFSKKFNET